MIWLRRVAVALGGIAVAALLLSGPGTRAGLWPYQVGLALFLVAGLGGLAAAVLSIVGLCIPKARVAYASWLAVALIVGLGSAVAPLEFLRQARSVPVKNQARTDAASELKPLALGIPADQAFAKALATARAMGWEIVSSDPAARRIEAVATTAWFGFKDDVSVNVSPAVPGSQVEMSSKSRVGRSDVGANARRIREYFERLK